MKEFIWANPTLDPQFYPSTLALISGVLPVPSCLYVMAMTPFGLKLVFELCVRTSVVHDGASVWFIFECRHGPFPSFPHRAIGRK